MRICPNTDLVGLCRAGGGRCGSGSGSLVLKMLLQLGGKFFGVRVAQVSDLRVPAVLERRIQVRDQCPQAQTVRLVAANQHTVGAGIGDQTG